MTIRTNNYIHHVDGNIIQWLNVIDDLTYRYLNDTNYVSVVSNNLSITFHYHFDINTTNRLKLLAIDDSFTIVIPYDDSKGKNVSVHDIVDPLRTTRNTAYLSFSDAFDLLTITSTAMELNLSNKVFKMLSVIPNDNSGDKNICKFLKEYHRQAIITMNERLDIL